MGHGAAPSTLASGSIRVLWPLSFAATVRAVSFTTGSLIPRKMTRVTLLKGGAPVSFRW